MSEPILIAVITTISGLLSGTVVSLLSPFINWGIKKKSLLREDRAKLISDLREIIIEEYKNLESFNKDLVTKKTDLSKTTIYPNGKNYIDLVRKHKCFHKIKPFLDSETIEILAKSNLLSLDDRGVGLGEFPIPLETLMNNISSIEKKWELI